jgi:hypothetical protein
VTRVTPYAHTTATLTRDDSTDPLVYVLMCRLLCGHVVRCHLIQSSAQKHVIQTQHYSMLSRVGSHDDPVQFICPPVYTRGVFAFNQASLLASMEISTGSGSPMFSCVHNYVTVSHMDVRRIRGCGCSSIVIMRIFKSSRLYHTTYFLRVFPLTYEYTFKFTRTSLMVLGHVQVYADVQLSHVPTLNTYFSIYKHTYSSRLHHVVHHYSRGTAEAALSWRPLLEPHYFPITSSRHAPHKCVHTFMEGSWTRATLVCV